MTWDDSECALPLGDDDLERTQRLPILKAPKRTRIVPPGHAMPLRGLALAEWKAWAQGGDTAILYKFRRAVV